ncbi:hypothetical protein ACHAWF_018607 [Thalassiosira exigua]
MSSDRCAPCSVTVSRYTIPCVVCSGTIVPGDSMFCSAVNGQEEQSEPTEVQSLSKSRKSLAWGHESCYSSHLPPPPTCRHWKRLGRCRSISTPCFPLLNANNSCCSDVVHIYVLVGPAKEMGMCAFQHEEVERGTSLSMDKQRWGGRRHYVRNQHKNSVFRIFLMQTYGLDYLNKKDGVIADVAGGKGELSFELINLSGVADCVVIDPRPLNLSLVQSKWKKGLFEPKRTGVFSKWYPACEIGCKEREPRIPHHLRCFFGSASFLEFVAAKEGKVVETTNQLMTSELERAKFIEWTTKGLQHENAESFEDEGDDESIDVCRTGEGINSSEQVDPAEIRNILQRCHLLVGFHPDQAAGDIVEFAMAMRIPWAVVPCCVYSDSFPQRKLRDGTNVTSYDQLIKWLCEKDPRARCARLDVEGKNTVVYTFPDDCR